MQQALGRCAERAPAEALRQLVALSLDELPLPGGGATLARWRALALVGAHDLSLAKLYEGHTDALAILQELCAGNALATSAQPGSLWAVWAAEAPNARVQLERDARGEPCLNGTKAWCSGAADVEHALLTAWWPDQPTQPQLIAVALRQPGVVVDAQSWQAVGMAASASASVRFEQVPAVLVGQPGDYLRRPGFWQGGAGVAACWHGAAVALAQALHHAARPDAPLRLAALGQVDVALSGTAALMREAAAWIDAHPQADTQAVALRVRQAVEHTARRVLDEVPRALGAVPLCLDAGFARRAADLPVFIRQSHGARDDAALGGLLCADAEPPWMP
nr:acyl-CoA dehydrogenase [Oryzisolibacter propanilivorax]